MLSGGQYQDQLQIVFDTGMVKLVSAWRGWAGGLVMGWWSSRHLHACQASRRHPTFFRCPPGTTLNCSLPPPASCGRLLPLHGSRGVPPRALQQPRRRLLILNDRLPAVRGAGSRAVLPCSVPCFSALLCAVLVLALLSWASAAHAHCHWTAHCCALRARRTLSPPPSRIRTPAHAPSASASASAAASVRPPPPPPAAAAVPASLCGDGPRGGGAAGGPV